MNKTLALVALLGLVSAPAFASPEAAKEAAKPAAHAEKHADKMVKETTTTTAVKIEATNAELKDGTKVVIKGEEVFVVGIDGKETAAPDAKHELKDGTFVTTKAGKIVK